MTIPDTYNYEEGYIGLLIDIVGLPKSIVVKGNKLVPKTEFHITLINAGAIAQSIDVNNANAIEKEIIDEFNKFIIKQPLDHYQLFKKFRFVTRDVRKSVITIASVPNLKEFFNILRKKYDKEIPYQPTHATIYVLPSKGGIGLLSDQQLEEDSVPVEIPELDNVKFDRISQ
jgi:hypothetical protein